VSELKCPRRLKAEKPDGLIMLHEITDPGFYEFLAEGPVPVVLCTFSREGLPFHSVHVDEVAAARAAIAHLMTRLIAGEDLGSDSTVFGYELILRESTAPFDESCRG
jgi:DNA-binding LacI/PurR family transcriptional regulator